MSLITWVKDWRRWKQSLHSYQREIRKDCLGRNHLEQQTTNVQRLRAIFDGDGEEIRKQFILAGLLLTIFERLNAYVIFQVDEFFCHRLEVLDGRVTITRGDAFKKLIKEHGKGESGQHGNEVFRAAMRWLGSFNAVEDWELTEIERLYSLRNDIGHELFSILADDKKNQITVVDVALTLGVYVKVVRWWFREVEASTDPDMTEEKWESIDFDGVESTDTVILREILNKTLGEMPEWTEMQEWAKRFTEQEAASSSSPDARTG